MMKVSKECPVCGDLEFTRSYTVRNYTYYSCNACGLRFLPEEEGYADSSSGHYNSQYFDGSLKKNMSGYIDYAKQSTPLRMYFRNILSHLRPYMPATSGLSILDVGCAYGFFLDEARKLGMKVHGLDLSEDAVKWMRSNLGIDGTAGLSHDAPDGPFDIVSAMEVIEHIKDPKPFIEDLRKRIKDNGLLLIHTGAADSPASRILGRWWWYLNPPDHCTIFTRRALRDLISASGFEVLDHRILSCHWVGLNNMLLKVARVIESEKLGRIAAKLPSLPIPVYEYCAQLLIARKR